MSKKERPPVVVIGIDDNQGSEYAFDFYLEHYHKKATEVVLVHVVEPHIYSSNQLTLNSASTREKNEAEDKMIVKNLQTKYEKKMRENRIKGRINVIFYCKQPGKSIAEVAKDEKASLIVLGKRFSSHQNSSQSTTLDYLIKKTPFPISVISKPDIVVDNSKCLTSPSLAVVKNKISNVSNDAWKRRTSCPNVHQPLSTRRISGTQSSESLEQKPFMFPVRKLEPNMDRRHSAFIRPFAREDPF